MCILMLSKAIVLVVDKSLYEISVVLVFDFFWLIFKDENGRERLFVF